jgi:hypothetical protein
MTANTVTTITRDDALIDDPSFSGLSRFLITSDAGAVFTPRARLDADTFYAVGAYGASRGLVVRVTRSGSRVKRNQLRVRIDFPRDTGDVAGTLAFGDAGHIGGWARAEFFPGGTDADQIAAIMAKVETGEWKIFDNTLAAW